MYFWVVLIVIILVTAALLLLRAFDQSRLGAKIDHYAVSYRWLLARIDMIRSELNEMVLLLNSRIDAALMIRFEDLVRDFERLLASLKAMPRVSTRIKRLEALRHLVKEMSKRSLELKSALMAQRSGQRQALTVNPSQSQRYLRFGCYFCSRPAYLDLPKKVNVKIDGDTLKVDACDVCRTGLKQKKKVKVLYFNRSGQSKHWSDIEDYIPDPAYFEINNPSKAKHLGRKPLKLVYSAIEKIADHDDNFTHDD